MALRPIIRHVTLVRSAFRTLTVETVKAITANSNFDPNVDTHAHLRATLEYMYQKAIELFDTEIRSPEEIRYDASLCCGMTANMDFASGTITLSWKKHDLGKVVDCVVIVHNEHTSHAEAVAQSKPSVSKDRHNTLFSTV